MMTWIVDEYIDDERGTPLFQVKGEADQYTFTAEVKEVTGWDHGNVPDEFEPYVKIFIKWDSCSHFNFENQLHLCSVNDYKKHIWFMEKIYKLAFEAMAIEPQPGERWWS